MQDDSKIWLTYAKENLEAAKVLFASELYNPCLHNVQQAVEKALKSLIIEKSLSFKKTHNIFELKSILEKNGTRIDLSEDECDFIDSIYLPTKYPIGSALPFFYPDEEICKSSILLAERVFTESSELLKEQ